MKGAAPVLVVRECTIPAVREQQARNYNALTVRCARCDELRPGSTAAALGEMRFEVPPWLDETWRYRPGEPVATMDERTPRWRFFPLHHGSSLAALRAGRAELVEPAVERALGWRTVTAPYDRTVSRADALRSRVLARIAELRPVALAPSAGVVLGPCRRCKHNPRRKLRDLAAKAERVSRSGGSSIFV